MTEPERVRRERHCENAHRWLEHREVLTHCPTCGLQPADAITTRSDEPLRVAVDHDWQVRAVVASVLRADREAHRAA